MSIGIGLGLLESTIADVCEAGYGHPAGFQHTAHRGWVGVLSVIVIFDSQSVLFLMSTKVPNAYAI